MLLVKPKRWWRLAQKRLPAATGSPSRTTSGAAARPVPSPAAFTWMSLIRVVPYSKVMGGLLNGGCFPSCRRRAACTTGKRGAGGRFSLLAGAGEARALALEAGLLLDEELRQR